MEPNGELFHNFDFLETLNFDFPVALHHSSEDLKK